LIVFDTGVPIAHGGSVYGAPTQIGTDDGLPVYENVATHELRTGVDLNGAAADITISVNPSLGHYFLDPTPSTADDVPVDRGDFFSVLLHELLHTVALSGFRDFASGDLVTAGESPFDLYVQMIDGQPYFVGPLAGSVLGQPVPLTPGNLYHYGVTDADPVTLLGGVMNGSAFPDGHRFDLNELDVAILRDCGLSMSTSTDERAQLWGSAGNDSLVAAAASSLHGLGGNDTLRGSAGADFLYVGVGQSWIDGGLGVDVAVFSGDGASYSVSQANGHVLAANASTSVQLAGVERLQFDDGMMALDLAEQGAGGAAARLIIAVMGVDALADKSLFGRVVGYLDSGLAVDQLCTAAVNLGIVAAQAGGSSNAAFVDCVFEHVVGISPSTQDAAYFTNVLDTAVLTQAQLLSFAVDHQLTHAWISNRAFIAYTSAGELEAPVLPDIELVGFAPQ
jgi:Ca2+-binding RTX toxin-like protein